MLIHLHFLNRFNPFSRRILLSLLEVQISGRSDMKTIQLLFFLLILSNLLSGSDADFEYNDDDEDVEDLFDVSYINRSDLDGELQKNDNDVKNDAKPGRRFIVRRFTRPPICKHKIKKDCKSVWGHRICTYRRVLECS